jgi:hypothetical protein
MIQTPWAPLPLQDRTVATWFVKRLPGGLRARAYARLCRARQRLASRAIRTEGDSGTRDAGDPGGGHLSASN